MDLLKLVWSQRRSLALTVVVGAGFGLTVSLIVPKTYEAHGSFVGTSGGLRLPANLGALAGLASQFGVSDLGASDGGSFSPHFFADLLTRDTILNQLAVVHVPHGPGGGTAGPTLMEIIGASGKSHADSVERGVKKLRRSIVVDIDNRSRVIELTFSAHDPFVAGFAADTLLGLASSFVTQNLQTRAGIQRRFLQERLRDADSEVTLQQNRLRSFLESNRDYRNSPSLLIRKEELERDIELKREIYLSIARSLEEARMNEVRDTPFLSIIDAPSSPVRPTSPKPIVNAVLLALFMPILWLAFILIRSQNVGKRPNAA